MRLAQDQYLRQKTNKRFTFPFFFLLQEVTVRAQNMRFGVGWLPGLGRPQTLQKGEHHRTCDHQSSTNCHLSHQSGQNKSKVSCYKMLGFSEKTASEDKRLGCKRPRTYSWKILRVNAAPPLKRERVKASKSLTCPPVRTCLRPGRPLPAAIVNAEPLPAADDDEEDEEPLPATIVNLEPLPMPIVNPEPLPTAAVVSLAAANANC